MNSLLRERVSRPSALGVGHSKVPSACAYARRFRGRKPSLVTAVALSDGPDNRNRAVRGSSGAGTSVGADGQFVSAGPGLGSAQEPTDPPQFTEEELQLALELLQQRGLVEGPDGPQSGMQPTPPIAPPRTAAAAAKALADAAAQSAAAHATAAPGGAVSAAAGPATAMPAAGAPGAPVNGARRPPAAALAPAAAGAPGQDDEYTALRKKARQEVASHVPAVAALDRHHWLVFTVPEVPVAGEEVVVYFNRNQSEALINRPRIVCQLAFNHWELDADISRHELTPTGIPHDMGADFWTCRFQVPEAAYEINFVLSDLEGTFDNNMGQDYTFAVRGPMTYSKWLDTSVERAVAAEKARVAAEAEKEARREAERQVALKEADRQRAADRVNELRNSYDSLRDGATTLLARDGRTVFTVFPLTPRAGESVTVLYNSTPTPLQWLAATPVPETLTLKYGFNSWKKGGDVAMVRCAPASLPEHCKVQPGDDWWEAELALPHDAVVANFVTTCSNQWDNNAGQDYKVAVAVPEEHGGLLHAWLASLQDVLEEEETTQRLTAEAEARAREQAREDKRRKAQETVQAVQRKQLRHVLFTEPETIEAGSTITLHYNPQNTCLAGQDKVFVHCGWNRWTHRQPVVVEMKAPAAGGATHFTAQIKVPLDAYKMDFVFANVGGGDGTYDNRMGLDYHLPIQGSPFQGNPLHVMHISVEMAPVAKVGGLGDVVTALGRAVKDQGHLVEIVLPWYEFFWHSPLLKEMHFETEFQWGGTSLRVTSTNVEGLRVFFINPGNGFFNTPTVYGRNDDEVRFDFFCNAALEFMLQTQRQPDIIHCHDWSTASVAQAFWQSYHPYGLWKPKIVFTIHNLEYGAKKIGQAAYFSQKFTTVSPTYAAEIAGNPVVGSHLHKFMGIRNGIDPELWDPSTCYFLPQPYTAETLEEGKAAARAKLRERLGLTGWEDKIIVAVVSRLTPQKGMHLIKHAAWRTLDRGGQFVLLGSAPNPKEQEEWNNFARTYGSDCAAFQFKYDEPLSHQIYAAADIVIVPSMFEPCGLTQMIAMRYGAVPVVRHTGGLRDTVFDVDFDKGRAAWDLLGSTDWKVDGDATNGFAFAGADSDALDYALNRAIDAWYNDKAWFRGLQRRVMEQDWSWNRPAIDYIELYFSALKA